MDDPNVYIMDAYKPNIFPHDTYAATAIKYNLSNSEQHYTYMGVPQMSSTYKT